MLLEIIVKISRTNYSKGAIMKKEYYQEFRIKSRRNSIEKNVDLNSKHMRDKLIRNDAYDNFISKIENSISNTSMYRRFTISHIRRLEINNEFIYLWQDLNGNVCYCFNILDKEYSTTSATKLGNVLSSHFQYNVEVVNNVKESLKKVTIATIGVNKAILDYEKYNEYNSYSQQLKLGESDVTDFDRYQTQSKLFYEQTPQGSSNGQEELHKEIIDLSVYQLEYNKKTYFISINELPIVHKELFRPHINQAFFIKEGLIYKNSFIATKYMLNPLFRYNLNDSFIFLFIFFMAKNNLEEAMKIFVWLSNTFNFVKKLPFTLVLHSVNDVVMKLFYEEIINPLLNPYHCEKLTNDSFNKKSLSSNLDKKAVYNFHNVTTPRVLDGSTKEFTNRLLHKEDLKIGNKIVTTSANILITSTTYYIPVIGADVSSLFVDVESSLDDFCKKYNLTSGSFSISNLIENDLDNFVCILKYIDMDRLNETCNLIHYDDSKSEIIDGNATQLDVFYKSIGNKDKVLFEVLKTKNEKLHQKLIEDFEKDRVDRKNLIEYFTSLFGTGIYKSNRALIEDLKDISNTTEPFCNIKTFNNNGRVYYRL